LIAVRTRCERHPGAPGEALLENRADHFRSFRLAGRGECQLCRHELARLLKFLFLVGEALAQTLLGLRVLLVVVREVRTQGPMRREESSQVARHVRFPAHASHDLRQPVRVRAQHRLKLAEMGLAGVRCLGLSRVGRPVSAGFASVA
jgi:signal transduction histidine kinase